MTGTEQGLDLHTMIDAPYIAASITRVNMSRAPDAHAHKLTLLYIVYTTNMGLSGQMNQASHTYTTGRKGLDIS